MSPDPNQPDDFIDLTNTYFAFDGDTQRAIKRTKIGVQLLEKKSDPKSKFDLFQRLNSGGIAANDQEIRNCAIVMVNGQFFEKLETLAKSKLLSSLIPLGPTSIKKSNDLDNLCKIMAFSFLDYEIGTDIEEFVTTAMVDVAGRSSNEVAYMFDKLINSMDLLVESCGYNALRPYRDGSFVGRIGRTSIEIILVGLVRCIKNVRSKANPPKFIRDTIIQFWQSEEAKKFSAAGLAGTDRVRFTIPLGEALFSK